MALLNRVDAGTVVPGDEHEERLRVAVYSDAATVGGAEVAAGHLLAELDDAIDAAVIGVEAEVADAIASRRPGTRVLRVPRVRNKGDLRATAAHARAVRHLRPDVLHVNLWSPWEGQYAIVAGLLSSVPVVAVEHLGIRSTSTLQRRVRRLLCTRLAAHVAVGDEVARAIEGLIGLSPGSVETIHNGIPDLPLTPVRRKRPGAVVGGVGRFTRQKGFDTLIAAMPSLPDVTCVLVGDGPERARLERLADDLGVSDRIVMTGWVEEARNYLASFDLVAQPSRYEGVPLVMIEAMLAKRAIVACDVGGVSEAVEDGRTGILIPPDDPAALAAALAKLLSDRGLRSEMGERARERALARFTSSAMARSYEALYARVHATARA
jgi:glycosyltransferase involved in cell wall biosynthesis